jgi:hypothetical protein
MALKPPARAGSSGSVGRGIFRRGRRLGELLVKQSTGGARAVLTDWVLEAKAANGAVTGTITYTGTIVGTKYEPAPDTPARRGGSGYYQPRPNIPQPKPKPAPVIRKSGRVSGVIALRGTIAGRKSTPSRRLAEPITYRCAIRGRKAASGVSVAHIATRAVIRGTGITAVTTTELRRLRGDADLMLML